MIKKVRKPGQARVRTSAQTTRNVGPSGLDRKKKKEAPKVEEQHIEISEEKKDEKLPTLNEAITE